MTSKPSSYIRMKSKIHDLKESLQVAIEEAESLDMECFVLYEGLDEWRKRALKAEEELKKLKEESAGPCS